MSSTVTISARVSAVDKKAAETVLVANRRTWSQAIQALAAYIGRTQTIPEELDPVDEDSERQRNWDRLMSLAGMSTSPDLATDEGADQILYEEMMRRHG